MTYKLLEAIAKITEYMYHDEEKNWEEMERPRGKHIFHEVKTLATYLNQYAKPKQKRQTRIQKTKKTHRT